MTTTQDRPVVRTAHGPVVYDTTDFASMSLDELLVFFEVRGYVVLRGLLDDETMRTVAAELEDLPMTMATTGSRIRFSKTHPPQFHSKTFAELIAHPRLVEFLEAVMGPDIVFMLGHYLSSGGGGDVGPGLALHSDYQPFGSEEKGFDESSPATLRVLVNITGGPDPSTELHERPPGGITFVPRSHISMHTFADPYVKYDNHPDMVTVPASRGDAVVFNVKTFHGGHPGVPRPLDAEPSNTLEFAYRPGWAKCVQDVLDWTPEQLATVPEAAKRFFRGRNAGPLDRPAGRVDALASDRVMR